MDASNTLKVWEEIVNGKLNKENFFDFTLNINQFLPVINDDFLKLFNNLIANETLIVANLEDINHINKAMNDFINEHENKNIIFTNQNYQIQNKILETFIEKNNQELRKNSYHLTYLTFGTLEYIINNKKSIAPLLFIPIEITKKDQNTFQIKALNNDIFLNQPLIEKLKKVKKIDLSYPLNGEFSLSEFIYYISVKVKPINWFVNSTSYISLFDFSYYYDLKMINENKEILNQNSLIKKISYLNSDFFAFKNSSSDVLENKFLSLLDIDREEYQLLKNVSTRENLFVRYHQNTNRFHLIANILSSFSLNNKRVLLAYSNHDEKNDLIEEIRKNSLEKFTLDLDYSSLDKKDLLAYLASYDNLKLTYNSLHPITIDEDVSSYYEIKNNFLSLMNGLRTTKNPVETSINKLVNNYYKFDYLPLLDIKFNEVEKIDLDVLQHYIKLIDDFSQSIEELEVKIQDHPFYGFNKKTMLKDDYTVLKNQAISLSSSLSDAKKIINYGNQKFNLPIVSTLKELKAELNLLRFIKYYQGKEKEWLDDKNIEENYEKLKEIYQEQERNNKEIDDLCFIYNPSITKLTTNQLNLYVKKKGKINYKKFKIDFQIKKVSKSEITYLVKKLINLFNIKEQINKEKENYSPSYISYLELNSIDSFKEIINQINIFKYNFNYLRDKANFKIKEMIDFYNIELEKHFQATQYVFNSILEASKIFQEFFDISLFNYEEIDFDRYLEKVSKISSNFSSINKYLKYYSLLHRLNNTIINLGDKLINYDNYKDYKNIYLKSVYYNLLKKYLHSKEFSENLTRDNLFTVLENCKDSDLKRKKIIEKIIINNFNNNIQTQYSNIKESEQSKIINILKQNKPLINLDYICESFNKSISNFKPIVLSSYKNISHLLKNPIYQFDCVIILANQEIQIEQILPCLVKAKQLIVVDEKPLTNDIRSNFIDEEHSNSIISLAKNNMKEVKFNREYHSVLLSMQKNLYDLDFKNYLMEKLKSYGFQVGINRTIKEHVIDILVKVKNSSSSVAIMVDHLPYYSPEEASNTFYYQENFIKELGYHPYRIFTSLYFIDEENELKKLIDYIIIKSKLIPELAIKKNSIVLMDYLFPLYNDCRKEYYNLNNIISLKEKLQLFLNRCAPISLEEIRVVFKENIEEELEYLANKNIIEIEKGFIYVVGKKVLFRRIDRDEEYYRPLDLVSEKEIYHAIYQILDYKQTLNKNTLIKMILLSLGYKKFNQAKYDFIDEKINYLLEKRIIFMDNDLLFKSI